MLSLFLFLVCFLSPCLWISLGPFLTTFRFANQPQSSNEFISQNVANEARSVHLVLLRSQWTQYHHENEDIRLGRRRSAQYGHSSCDGTSPSRLKVMSSPRTHSTKEMIDPKSSPRYYYMIMSNTLKGCKKSCR